MNSMFKLSRYFIGGILLFSSLSNVQAIDNKPDYTSPESLPGSVRVSAEVVIGLVGSIDNLVVIDSRTTNDRKMGFIEGSIGLTDTKTNCKSLKSSLPELDTPVLFYCNGINCERSDNAVRISYECGYRKIYWFRGGIEEWREKKLPLVQ